MLCATNKRIYDFKLFMNDIRYIAMRVFAVIDAYKSARIPWPFAEKIMLATTAVNECTYCARLHTQLASLNGVSSNEIAQLLSSEIAKPVEDYEYRALCFAQHYTETDRKPAAAELSNLVEFYGSQKANDIMLYIRIIYIGNLMGNTFDALLSRLRGKPHQQSNLFFEAFLFLVVFPLIVFVAAPTVLILILLSIMLPFLRQLAPKSNLPAT